MTGSDIEETHNAPFVLDRFAKTAIYVIAAVLLTKLIFLGIIDLLPEEAYYWNYAAHLDTGYLDHPPMVGWLVWLSTSVFGQNEFAVRLPAFLGWLGFAYFMFRLAFDMGGRRTVVPVLLLIAVLPIYWSVGFLLTPDAPLYVFWAAALFYLRRALVDRSQRSWLGAGLAIGFGLLSKYTIGLLAGAVFLFLLLDRPSRTALRTAAPYLAVAIAIAIFSPVLYWNAKNDWISFAFQGSRRWSMVSHIHLHILLGSALLLLTPVGFVDAVRTIYRGIQRAWKDAIARVPGDRDRLFALVFCLAPLIVFVVHSISNQTKLNWTGPVWLSILPYLATRLVKSDGRGSANGRQPFSLAWAITISVLVLLYPAGLTWLAMGGPEMPLEHWERLPVAWEEFSTAVERIEESIEQESGAEPLIAGTDKYWIASQLSFYHSVDGERDSLPEFAGSSILQSNDLMWSQWMPSASARGRDIILIGFDRSALDDERVGPYFPTLTPVVQQPIERHGRKIGAFYWRLCMDYTPPQ